MEASTLKMICTKSKLGHSLSQISELTGLTIDQVKERLGQATSLSPEALSNILLMKQRGLSFELISQEFDVELEVLKQFLPQVIKKTVETQIDALADLGKGPYEISLGKRAYTLGSPDDCKAISPPTTTEKTKKPPQSTMTLLPKPQHIPTFFYCCQNDTNKLRRVNLLTGEQSCHEVPNYQFKNGCRWSELPGGRLLITGGESIGVRDVVKIDTLREYAVSSQPPMHTARQDHAAVYHFQYVYVLGGTTVTECERYSCAASSWEMLPPLPIAGRNISAVEVQNSLYALGGRDRSCLDIVQKLSLESLTWELLQLKLPQAAQFIPCFKIDTQVYLIVAWIIYSFTPLQLNQVGCLPRRFECYSSYYSRGTIYLERGSTEIDTLVSSALGI
jgi:hypothetical protein